MFLFFVHLSNVSFTPILLLFPCLFPSVYVIPQEDKDKHRANNDFIFVVEYHGEVLSSQCHVVQKYMGVMTYDDLIL